MREKHLKNPTPSNDKTTQQTRNIRKLTPDKRNR